MTPEAADLRVALDDARKANSASSYARSGIIRIADLFPVDVAEALHRHLDTQIE
jgi:hypothetical protein